MAVSARTRSGKPYNSVFFATKRDSHVVLQNQISSNTPPLIIPIDAQEISLTSGDFSVSGDGQNDVALAMVDADGQLKINIYYSYTIPGDRLVLIGTAEAGAGHSVSIATGQFDSDAAHEYIVTFVQPDNNQVVAIIFNTDGSIINKTVVGLGKQPSVSVGHFTGTGDSFVVAYLSLNNKIESAIFQANGSLISESNLDLEATYIKVTKADILRSDQDDYVISFVKPNGIAAVIGLSSHSAYLGGLEGGISSQPTVTSGSTPGVNSGTLAISLIQADKKPAIIFLDNQGNFKGMGVGATTATIATHVLYGKMVESDVDRGALLYIDEAGVSRWEAFSFDGVRLGSNRL